MGGLTQKEIISREHKILNYSYQEITDFEKKIYLRKKRKFIEYDFNMPQTIFFIYGNGMIIFGRKTLSQYYLNKELKSLNCSRITSNMLFGIKYNSKYKNRKITISYYPFNLKEKIEIFNKIVNNRNLYYIEYPYHFKYFTTCLEQTSDDINWKVNNKTVKYLSIGESHIRRYVLKSLKSHEIEPKYVYDPACSTGEFLFAIKKLYPNSITIGHDLSKEMVNYSKKYVDYSFCCDAINSPLKNESIDLLILRFLNGGVVSESYSKELFKVLIMKVKKGGYIICIGHTPILIKKGQFISANLSLLETIGYDTKSNSIFQYYLAKKE